MPRRLLPPLLVAALLFACVTVDLSFDDPPLQRPEVDRINEDAVKILWPDSFSSGPVEIFAGPSPDAINRSRRLAAAEDVPVRLRASADNRVPSRDVRSYYELVPNPAGAAVVTAERRLPLRSLDNFRDLGGYETADGHTVRWGRLYRGNAPKNLGKQDIAYLSRLGIKLVCDFRSERVRQKNPSTPILPDPPEIVSLPVDPEGVDPGAMQERIRTGGIAALGIEDVMIAAYRSLVTDHSPAWAAMFRRIEDPANLPTLVHCTAGKDRTGFASALVLLALGVPEKTVYEDYLLTNRYREKFHRFVLRWVPFYSLFRTNPEDLVPLLEARREYLEASFATIDELHGSIDAYLEGPLGVTPARRAALRENLLR